ncbi:MAG: hypothetical protein K5681_10885 [Treponema sp.]|nr:hypothetical protein [Treponema sp.]
MKKKILGAVGLLFSVLCLMPLSAEEEIAEEKKNYTGWVDTSAKELNFKDGIVQLRVKPTLGTFNFLVLNDNDKYIPVLSTVNEYTSSGFFLKAGKKRYRLLSDKNVQTSVSKNEAGFNIYYKVAKAAEVVVELESIRSYSENDVDMVKVTATVKNVGQKSDDFALRAVLDTILGESDSYHFYGMDNSPIKSEVLYRSVKDQRWIYSRNSNAVMQLLLDGADISQPELVALANYATMEKTAWEPDMAVYRTFDTVLSYKNSAIGINWPSARLKPNQSVSYVFCLALAADGNVPQGALYVGGKVPEKPAEPEPEPVEVVEKLVPQPIEEKIDLNSKKPDLIDEFAVRRDVPFNVNNLSKEQLTLEYVQNLIDRISALEENSSSVNRKEILQLNAELDAILSILRQQ